MNYTEDGVTFKRTSFLNKSTISRLEKTKDGIILEGYTNDQIEGMKAIVGTAVESAVRGAKGTP